MSLDQANAFRDYVSQNEDVQREIRSALMTESAKVSEIAAKHGFSFTSEEGQRAWDACRIMNSVILSWMWWLAGTLSEDQVASQRYTPAQQKIETTPFENFFGSAGFDPSTG